MDKRVLLIGNQKSFMVNAIAKGLEKEGYEVVPAGLLSLEIKNIENKTLILSGKFDESTPRINELMNKEIKNSKWVLLEKSHHIGYAEEPELVLDEILKFIK